MAELGATIREGHDRVWNNFDESSVMARAPLSPQQDEGALKVLLIASAGGHWIELTKIASAFQSFHCHFLSTAPGLKSPLNNATVEQIPDFSRHSLLVGVKSILKLYAIIRRHDPDIVLSTGAAPGALAICLAKFRGCRTIWIDSLANYDGLSLSAKFAKPLCDRTVTQWPHLASPENGIEYWGRII